MMLSYTYSLVFYVWLYVAILSESYDPELYSQYSCGDELWKLSTPDPYWNMNISIFTLSNVFIRPGMVSEEQCPMCYKMRVYPWFFINASIIPSPTEINANNYANSVYEAAMDCTKGLEYRDQNTNHSRLPVFFNFPCATAPHWRWEYENYDLYAPPSKMNRYLIEPQPGPLNNVTRDILFVFNSWSATSFYHVVIETIFPLWVTYLKSKESMLYSTDSITFMNLSPTCRDEPHQYKVKPILDKMFGYGTYEATCGQFSQSFSNEVVGFYKRVVYGFHYPLRPYRDHVLVFNRELGSLFRNFTEVMKRTFVNYTAVNIENSLFPTSYQNITLISREGQYESKRNFGVNASRILNNMLSFRNLSLNEVLYGKGKLESIEAQATLSARVNILIGAEGAGFVQQIFMPYNSLLFILHPPRGREITGKISGSQWHEAVGQYLDHSVVNIVTTRLDELTLESYERISNITALVIAKHIDLKARRMFFSCNLAPIFSTWNGSLECVDYQERKFLNDL